MCVCLFVCVCVWIPHIKVFLKLCFVGENLDDC